MTTLTKIRNRAGLLVGIIAFALFAFVLGDFFRSGQKFFGDNPTEVGLIGDQSISIDEFNAKVDQAVENEKQRQQKANLDESTIDMLRQQTWNQMVYESVMKKQFDAVGVAVGTAELFDMVQGKNPHASVVQAFTDPKTGQFSPGAVVNFLKNLDQNPETKQRWLTFEKAIKAERLSGKYNNLVKNGLYVTKSQAKANYTEMGRTAKFQFVTRKFAEIPDSTVKVDESDLRNYYNQHKFDYKQNESVRAMDYVVFDAQPSAEDQKLAFDDITKLAPEFKDTKEDTAFITGNSDAPLAIASYKKSNVPANIDTVLFNAPVGTTMGPYQEGMTYKVAKLVGVSNKPDSVKARHILIKIVNNDTKKARATADSLKVLLTSKKAKFDELAVKYSEDAGSKIKGGDLGWFKEGQMVPTFNDACFNGKKGEMPIVESQFGIHLIEITDKGKESKSINVAYLVREVRPSNKTFQSFYAKASEFAGKNNTAESFDKAIVDMGMNKRIADNVKELDRNLPGIQGARDIVRWAYKAKQNEISPVFEASGKYIVAKLTAIKDKGTLPFETVKDKVEIEAKREKKADMMAKEMEDAIKGGSSSLDALATKFKTSVMNADNANFGSGFVPGLGREEEVSGYVFAAPKKSQLSKVIKGEMGVYVIKVDEVVEPAASADNFKTNRDQLTQQTKQRADYELFEALKDKADVKDNRAKFM